MWRWMRMKRRLVYQLCLNGRAKVKRVRWWVHWGKQLRMEVSWFFCRCGITFFDINISDTRRLSTLLLADTFELLGADNTSPLLEWICDLGIFFSRHKLWWHSNFRIILAFSTSSLSLGSQAFAILYQRPKLFTSSGISFDVVIKALSQLGAKRTVLEKAGWSPIPNSSNPKPTKEQREEILLRLTSIISVYSRYVSFPSQFLNSTSHTGNIQPSCFLRPGHSWLGPGAGPHRSWPKYDTGCLARSQVHYRTYLFEYHRPTMRGTCC